MTDLSPSAANGVDRSLKGDPPIADISARPAAAQPDTAHEKALSQALGAALKEAKVMFDARAKTLTEQARETLANLKIEAERRRVQGGEIVRHRPYAALAAAALGGFLVGRLMSAPRTQVVLLKDDR